MAERNPRASRASKRNGTPRRAGADEPAPPQMTGSVGADTSGAQSADPGAGRPTAADADAGSEPIVFAERITVIAEAPLGAGDAEIAAGAQAAPATGESGVAAELRYLMISERAYERARQRGFAPGGELEDWLLAEQEVDAQLAGR